MTIAGVVLTGGASRRMGRTKALVEVGGTPMADRVATVLRAVGCRPVVAIGGDPSELAVLSVPTVPDRYPGEGPLGGVLSALEMLSDVADPAIDGVVVAACDLPDLTTEAVQAVIAAGSGRDDEVRADVVAAATDRLEPALAMWRVGSLPAIRTLFERGERALHRVIEQLTHTEVAVDPSALRNVNTPAQLRSGDATDG